MYQHLWLLPVYAGKRLFNGLVPNSAQLVFRKSITRDIFGCLTSPPVFSASQPV